MKTLALLILLATGLAHAGPKYGPDAVPLSRGTNHAYFREHPAPDFWALIPYYLPQPTESSCSAANLTMVLNAAREKMDLKSDDKLLTVESFAKGYTDEAYEKAVLKGALSMDRSTLSNKNLARLLGGAAEKLKLKGASVERVDVDLKNLDQSRKKFIQALRANEQSADDFIVISFIQGTLTGDPEGGAHVATIGAYDQKRGLVLILDPDREWYEPYWSPVAKVFDAISDPRSDSIHPGWIHFIAR